MRMVLPERLIYFVFYLAFISFIVTQGTSLVVMHVVKKAAASSSSVVGRKIRTVTNLSIATSSRPADASPSPQYYLLKSEPDEFSIDSLVNLPAQTGPWDGIRNVQARNHLRSMRRGDLAFFYHSSCGGKTGIYGVCEVVRTAFSDMDSTDPSSERYDPKAPADGSKWSCVEVKLVEKWSKPVLLSTLKACPALAAMTLFRQSRLSVQVVSPEHWAYICDTLRHA